MTEAATKYRRRPEIVDAWQYHAGRYDHPSWLGSKVLIGEIGGGLVGSVGKCDFKDGDWIVRDASGFLNVIPGEHFRRLYEEVRPPIGGSPPTKKAAPSGAAS